MTCLSRILTEQQKDDLDKPSDWICMCCTNHVSQASPSLNCSKWQIIGPNHKKNGRNYSSNKYDLKEKNNIKNNFLTDEFISLLTIPKDLCKKIKNQKKEKNKKKKRYENSVNSDKNKMCNLQNSMEFIEERNSLLNKKIVSNSARIESSSSISILSKSSFHSVSESKLKNTRIKDVTFIMNEKEKKCIIQDSPMNSINKIQNKLLNDISKGITPLRNCRLQKLNQNFDKIIPEIKLKNISIIASKTQLKTNKAQSLIMKEFSSVKIPKVNLELSLPPVSSTVDEVYYFSQYIHVSYLSSFFYY